MKKWRKNTTAREKNKTNQKKSKFVATVHRQRNIPDVNNNKIFLFNMNKYSITKTAHKLENYEHFSTPD